ncbi:hypothetical protein BASA81_010553 [Batrachochytrium salamandrivorans]|nr:hypothetical protein BASA81_010553 [Batrachochytrium salamandrivorans]
MNLTESDEEELPPQSARKGEEVEEEEEVVDTPAFSQATMHRAQLHQLNSASGAARVPFDPLKHTRGKVTKIELFDFMCHKSLTVNLASGINFITGPNGSGKSAIVAALQVALGLKASATGRGSKMSDLIRQGAEGPAIVRVYIQNDRQVGFMYPELGEVILVERTLHPTASSSSKIINAQTKRVVCTKAADVAALCEEFCLYVDNPCCVMDQDEVKVFLRGTAEEKYKFFLKAADLENIALEHDRVKETRREIKLEYNKKRDSVEVLKVRKDAAVKEYTSLMALRNTNDDLARVRRELLWANVNYNVQELEKKRKTRDEVLHLYQHAQRELDELDAEAIKSEQRKCELTSLGAKFKVQMEARKDALEVAKKNLARESKPINELKLEYESKKQELDKNASRRDAMQHELNLILRSQSDDRVLKLAEELCVKRDRLKNLESALEQSAMDNSQSDLNIGHLLEHRDSLDQQLASCRSQSDATLTQLRQVESDVARTQNELSTIQHTKVTSHLSKYAHWVPQLMDLINQNANRFRQLPLFVGEHVKLREERYIKPVEQAIYATLLRFVCDCIEDEGVLRRLGMDRLKLKGNELDITVRKFRSNRLAASFPPGGFRTIASVLDISNHNVFNVLVDSNRIEGLVLVDTKDEGFAMFQGTMRNASLPERVIAVIDAEGNNFSVRGGSRVFDANSNTKAPRLLTGQNAQAAHEQRQYDLHQKLIRLQSQLTKVQGEDQSHSTAMTRLRQDLELANRNVNEYDNNLKQSQREQRQLNKECDAMQQKLDELTQSDSNSKLERAKNQVEIWQTKTKEVKQEMEDLDRQIEKLERELLPPLEHAVELADRDWKKAKLDTTRALEEIDKFSSEYQPHSKVQAQAQVAQEKKQYDDMASECKQDEEKLTQMRMEALEQTNGEEVVSATSRRELEKQFKILNKALEEEAKRSANGQESTQARLIRIEKEKERAEKNYDNLHQDLEIVERRLKRMKKTMAVRVERFKVFQAFAETKTKDVFSELLRQKGQDGDVAFNHETNKLEIKWHRRALAAGSSTQIAPGEDSEEEEDKGQDGVSDVKSLSGGERSMTTLALLLAMGRNVASPLRVMDEFDVFMDAVTRKIAIDQLIIDAKQSLNGHRKQCIFLTPLDISDIPESPDLAKLIIEPNAETYGTAGRSTKRLKQ